MATVHHTSGDETVWSSSGCSAWACAVSDRRAQAGGAIGRFGLAVPAGRRRTALLEVAHMRDEQRRERHDGADDARRRRASPRTPIAAATGPVSAKESGSRPIEISQSRLETRPSIAAGHVALLDRRPDDRARRLERVEGALASISCQTAVASP